MKMCYWMSFENCTRTEDFTFSMNKKTIKVCQNCGNKLSQVAASFNIASHLRKIENVR
jgi:hypothetical protein